MTKFELYNIGWMGSSRFGYGIDDWNEIMKMGNLFEKEKQKIYLFTIRDITKMKGGTKVGVSIKINKRYYAIKKEDFIQFVYMNFMDDIKVKIATEAL